MATKEEVEKRLEDVLTARFNGFTRRDTYLMARQGSTSVRFWVTQDGGRICVYSPVAYNVPLSDELCWFLLEDSTQPFRPWNMVLVDDSTDRVNVGLMVERDTEGLDDEEIGNYAAVLAPMADSIDDEFVARFGGTTDFD